MGRGIVRSVSPSTRELLAAAVRLLDRGRGVAWTYPQASRHHLELVSNSESRSLGLETRMSGGRRAVLALGAGALLADKLAHASECPDGEAVVVVDTSAHALKLCEKGVRVKQFPVALGRGGTGKMREGDNQTPLGVYAMGTPKPSTRFGVFIPVGYPTKEQAAAGLTGADIGLHGPDRRFRFLGRVNVWFDWTAGCVAVGTDEAIHEIAAWIEAKRVGFVQLN
jgi:hypothetical protein